MNRKIIFGVNHTLKARTELDFLLSELDKHKASKAGLELPQNYLQLRRFGITTSFFNDVEEYLQNRKVKVIPLDNPELVFKNYILTIAKNVLEKRGNEEKLREKVKNLNLRVSKIRPYTPPEIAYFLTRDNQIYSRALEIIDSRVNLDEVNIMWKDNNMKREEKMIEVVKENELDILVVGLRHAYSLKEKSLDYEIIDICKLMEFQKV